MEQFIPGMYEQTDIPNRYTYTGGTTTGGAILYDGDLFLYSHHATDPCSGQLVNAFDLIRLHMYGDLDKEAKEGTPSVKLPSFQAMAKMARADKEVSTLLIKEKFEQAKKVSGLESPAREEDGNVDWVLNLTKDGNGKIEKTIANVTLVLENDPLLKGKIVIDQFASCGMVLGALPWDQREENAVGKMLTTQGITDIWRHFTDLREKKSWITAC